MRLKKILINIAIVISVGILCYMVIKTSPKMRVALFPTQIETIECNWKIKLPKPNEKKLLKNTRGKFHGEGDEINEFIYKDEKDIKYLNNSFQWFGYEEIPTKMTYDVVMLLRGMDGIKEKDFNGSVDKTNTVIRGLNKEAKYFYKKKLNNNDDIILLILEDNKLTIYESYM